jgi:FkbH-like protein
MHQRTNQFNLTSRRLTEADLAAHVAHPTRALVIIGRVIDKFGDHGLVTAATVSIEHTHAEIETFLMSCRVIGRGIEQAFLAALLTILANRGIDHVVGRYFPTEKNAMVREFYPASGFAPIEPHENAATWSFNMKGQKLPKSQFVSVTLEV